MKNRRNIIVAFLLCACLIVGVGYANLTTNLILNGSASLSKEYMEDLFDSQIKWVSAKSASNKVTAEISEDGNTITLKAEALTTPGEVIDVVCKMKNASPDLTVNVIEPTFSLVEAAAGDKEYFEVNVSPIDKTVLAPNEEGTVTVSFKLKKPFIPTEGKELVKVSFNLTYNVEAVAAA
jgi:cytochrome c oxidase assembly protein Cox11